VDGDKERAVGSSVPEPTEVLSRAGSMVLIYETCENGPIQRSWAEL
jgi:hypothetical protein